MRFTRLVSFFKHRRSKSDTLLALKQSNSNPSPPRPASSSFLDSLGQDDSANSLVSEVIASVPIRPVQVSLVSSSLATGKPSPSLPLTGISSFDCAMCHCPHDSKMSVIDVKFLQDRVNQLELTTQAQNRELQRIPELEAELATKWNSLRASEETISNLTMHVVGLQGDLSATRAELSSVLARTEAAHHDLDHLAALEADNDRLRRFLGLMFSVGAHRFVLEQSCKKVLEGDEPEAVVVEAVRAELEKPDSVWKTLFNPIIGERASDNYSAQVNLTLRARSDARDWRKKANFWKLTAQEDGEHLDTITPSTSKMSDCVDQLSPQRQAIVDKMMVQLKEGTLSLTRQKTIPRVTEAIPFSTSTSTGRTKGPTPASSPYCQVQVTDQSVGFPCVTASPLLSPIYEINSPPLQVQPAHIREDNGSLLEGPLEEIFSPQNAVHSPVTSKTIAAVSPPSYANLAPLASVTFRESHSIRTLPASRTRQDGIISFSSMHLGGITTSVSLSSQGSRSSQKSLRRKMNVLGEALAKKVSSISDAQSPVISTTADKENMQESQASGSFPVIPPAERLNTVCLTGAPPSSPPLSLAPSWIELAYLTSSPSLDLRFSDSQPRVSLDVRSDTIQTVSSPCLVAQDPLQMALFSAGDRNGVFEGANELHLSTTGIVFVTPSATTQTFASHDLQLNFIAETAYALQPRTETVNAIQIPFTARSPTPLSSPPTSPTKKSKLPVFRSTVVPQIIRRMSMTISRPVLVNTTNAAAHPDLGSPTKGSQIYQPPSSFRGRGPNPTDQGKGAKEKTTAGKETKGKNSRRAQSKPRTQGRSVSPLPPSTAVPEAGFTGKIRWR